MLNMEYMPFRMYPDIYLDPKGVSDSRMDTTFSIRANCELQKRVKENAGLAKL